MEEIEKSIADLKRIADSLTSEITYREKRKTELTESIAKIKPAEEKIKDCDAQISVRKLELEKLKEKRIKIKGEVEKGESRLLQQAEKEERERSKIEIIKKKQRKLESVSNNKIQIAESELEKGIKEANKEATESLENILYKLSEEIEDKKGELYRTDGSLERATERMVDMKKGIKGLEVEKKELTEDIFSLMDEKEEFNKLK